MKAPNLKWTEGSAPAFDFTTSTGERIGAVAVHGGAFVFVQDHRHNEPGRTARVTLDEVRELIAALEQFHAWASKDAQQ